MAAREQRSKVLIAASAVLLLGGGAWATVTLTGSHGRGSAEAGASPGAGVHGTAALADAAGPDAAGAVADAGQQVARRYLEAWQAGDYTGMHDLVADTADDLARAYGGLAERLHVSHVTAVPTGWTATGPDAGTQGFRATLTLTGLGDVGYEGKVAVQRMASGWRVRFTADTVYPGLLTGQRLDLVAEADAGPRLVDRTGKDLAGDPDLAANLVGTPAGTGQAATGLRRVVTDTAPSGSRSGRPAQALVVVDASTGARVSTLRTWAAAGGTPVRTTLDLAVQRAAERALGALEGPAALVAIDARTGEVRALANRPTSGIPVALNGSFPPGSTFKVVTAAAALRSGLRPTSPVPCPPTITVGTRTIGNHRGESAPAATTLTTAFARSCNTAFVGLAAGLPAGALHETAALFGFDAGQPLPIASVGGRAPEPSGPAELAEDAIGQGTVEASPLQMASVAAAVADGTWRQPHVLPCRSCTRHAVPGAAGLRSMMRAVVTAGTATRLARVPGGPVYGKTGTAEYGSGSPLPTHAWFIGWQGGLAFAVFVHDGASGAETAVPVAERFLRALPRA